MKTSELIGPALDLAVSRAGANGGNDGWGWFERDSEGFLFDPLNECRYSPSTDWAQGGPIIEREQICIGIDADDGGQEWEAQPAWYGVKRFGPTPLIAAMRCYVASKLGDEIEIPEELQ